MPGPERQTMKYGRMSLGRLSRIGLVICLAGALPVLAQTGHPAKGSWLGYWGPDADDQRRLRLVLDWDDRKIVGTINPGRNGVEIESADIDYDTWTLTLQAEMPVPGGSGKAHWTATGKLENLGSWTNRKYTGTYRLGNESGTFDLTLN